MGRGACRVTDLHLCPQFTVIVPHVGGPAIPAAPVTVMAEGLPALRLADFAFCIGPQDVLSEGAATVLVGGLPWVGRFHKSVHGGLMLLAASTVQIGDPTFSMPPQVKVKGPSSFQNKVIRDLFLLSTTPSGKELFRRIAAADQPITIVPESDPHNSFAAPNNNDDATHHRPTGSSVMYNPDVAILAYDSSGNKINMSPQVVLGHEMIHALNNAEGTHHYGTDPAPPASEPTINEEEAATIGTGSHAGDPLTENTFRNDLGQGRRDNHYGEASPTGPTGSLRPGGY
jgi:uncharacterized Zn-binding protein involved in type VI secretion